MINTKSKNKKLTRCLTVLILLGGFFLVKREVLAWSEPSSAPTGGNVLAPINVSSTQQIKIGPLTLGDTANPATGYGVLRLVAVPAASSLPTSCPGEAGQLIYQSGMGFYYCPGVGGWQAMASVSGFQLFNASQTGWGYLKNTNSAHPYTLKAVGYNVDGGADYYAGVEGAAGMDNANSIGVYGWDKDFPLAYAGYFLGNVMISKSTGLGADTKLQVGSGGADIVSLCLNDSGSGINCRTDWPLGGGSFWTQNDYDTYLTKTDKNLALGGGGQNTSAFYVNVKNNLENNVTTLIGQPEDLAQDEAFVNKDFFCGDGACQAWEGNVAAPGITVCSQDCPPAFTDGPRYQKILSINTIIFKVDENYSGRFCYANESYYDLNNSYEQNCQDITGTANTTKMIQIVVLSGTKYYVQVKLWDTYGNVNYGYVNNFVAL